MSVVEGERRKYFVRNRYDSKRDFILLQTKIVTNDRWKYNENTWKKTFVFSTFKYSIL